MDLGALNIAVDELMSSVNQTSQTIADMKAAMGKLEEDIVALGDGGRYLTCVHTGSNHFNPDYGGPYVRAYRTRGVAYIPEVQVPGTFYALLNPTTFTILPSQEVVTVPLYLRLDIPPNLRVVIRAPPSIDSFTAGAQTLRFEDTGVISLDLTNHERGEFEIRAGTRLARMFIVQGRRRA